MLASVDTIAGNFLFTGKGNDSGRQALEDIVRAGAGGLKLHEVRISASYVLFTCVLH